MFMEVDREIVKGQWIACARDLCRELTSRVVEWGIHELGERVGMGRESGCVVAGVAGGGYGCEAAENAEAAVRMSCGRMRTSENLSSRVGRVELTRLILQTIPDIFLDSRSDPGDHGLIAHCFSGSTRLSGISSMACGKREAHHSLHRMEPVPVARFGAQQGEWQTWQIS
ncbi:hypothetical protein [Burkholderia gladioli]|uniref:hypothetical protein n=1 Tax=Burkholderia gladioli TaxID=28095 RepID=UPI00163E8335|nr:hypothetical protein [Burkholderia gladioli]